MAFVKIFCWALIFLLELYIKFCQFNIALGLGAGTGTEMGLTVLSTRGLEVSV